MENSLQIVLPGCRESKLTQHFNYSHFNPRTSWLRVRCAVSARQPHVPEQAFQGLAGTAGDDDLSTIYQQKSKCRLPTGKQCVVSTLSKKNVVRYTRIALRPAAAPLLLLERSKIERLS